MSNKLLIILRVRYLALFFCLACLGYTHPAYALPLAKASLNSPLSPTKQNYQVISGTRPEGASVVVSSSTAKADKPAYPTASSWSCLLSNLREGRNTIMVRAKDKAGNLSPAILGTIFLDTSKPKLISITPQDGSTLYDDETITLSAAVEDIDPATPIEYQFSLDGELLKAFSPQEAIKVKVPAFAAHTLNIEVKDTGGQDTKEIEFFVVKRPIGVPQE